MKLIMVLLLQNCWTKFCNFVYGVAHTPERCQGMAICTIWGLFVKALSI